MKNIGVDIRPETVAEQPELCCDIYNFDVPALTITECNLIVDGNQSSLKYWNLQLPYTFKHNSGGGFCFHVTALLTEAAELGHEKIKVQAVFRDNTGKTYSSKTVLIDTHPKGISVFDNQYRLSESVKTTLKLAEEIAEQLQQQLVESPHVLLGLIREQTGVGGIVLRELGLQEDFLLSLAKTYPNIPRDYLFPHPTGSKATQELLSEFMPGEARKMRQKWQGTGHLLLGLTWQRNETLQIVLNNLDIRPRKVRNRVYQALRTQSNPKDHPTLPPEGVKRYVWEIWYLVAHNSMKLLGRAFVWLYPDFEI